MLPGPVRVVGLLAFTLCSALTMMAQKSATCQFTLFDVGPSGQPIPTSINRWHNIIGQDQDLGPFIRYADGRIQALHYGPKDTFLVTKRNAFGVTVGEISGKGMIASGGTVRALAYPNADETTFTGINRYGTVVGQAFKRGTGAFADTFVLRGSTFTKFPLPASANSLVISDAGVIAGNYYVTDPNNPSVLLEHGFVYANGVFRDFVVPGRTTTNISDINATGMISGSNYVYKNGTFYTVSFPAVTPGAGSITGMNGFGEITGWLTPTSTTIRAFKASCQYP